MVLAVAVVEKIFGPKEDFSPHRHEITVSSSEVNHRITSGTNHYVTVVGIVTNRSDKAWENVNLEAQFFNAAGQLIDVIPGRGDYSGIAILGHSEAAFKIETRAARAISEYARHEVLVSWGKDAAAWP